MVGGIGIVVGKRFRKRRSDNTFNIIISIIEIAAFLFFVSFTLHKWINNNIKNEGVVENSTGYHASFEEEEALGEDVNIIQSVGESTDNSVEESTDNSAELEKEGAIGENANVSQAGEESAGNNAESEKEETIGENGNVSQTGEENNRNNAGFEEEEEFEENGNESSSENNNSGSTSEGETAPLPPKAPTQDGEWGNPINN